MATAAREASQAPDLQPDLQPVDLARTVTVVTPESTALEFELAGAGSRFAALLIDTLWQLLLALPPLALAALPLAAARGWPEVGRVAARYLIPLAAVAAFGVFWGYYVFHETLHAGQTPGKRALGLRVVAEDGRPVGFGESALRNILRCADLLPLIAPYLLGGLAVLASGRRQRIGDLVAGTLVIRERPTPWVERLLAGQESGEAHKIRFNATQLDRLGPDDVELIGRLLRRREALPLATRRELAGRLAAPLRHRLTAETTEIGPDADEAWLEALLAAWSARRRRL